MVESVLLVCSTDKGTAAMVDLLKSTGYPHLHSAKNGMEARRLTAINHYDLIVINAPLTDEFGSELAANLVEATGAGLLLLVKNDMVDEVYHRLERYGVLVVGKPINRAFFYQTLRFIEAANRRVMGLQNQNEKLVNRIEEIRLVDRAKCLLMEQEHLTEAQAHRKLEKDAMDQRKTRRVLAEEIIQKYQV